MVAVKRLNHAVLYVRDAENAAAFYQEAFEFQVVARLPATAVFLRAKGTENHHDLALFSIGPAAPGPERGRVGLYHLAWEVATIQELVEARATLLRLGALVGESDHGATKSLYGHDPDGNEFEVMWMTPREAWDEDDASGTSTSEMVAPLDLAGELARWGS